MREVKSGQIYRHFKGDLVKVICLAKDSENLEEVVVYEHKGEIWVRSLAMFLSKIDKKKYPDAKGEYRFEEVYHE